jgi:hypothetical protein
VHVDTPPLNFPVTFCANCGDTDCVAEIQDTRVTRYFGSGGVETTFKLPVPICAACRRTTRRRPSGAVLRVLVWAATTAVLIAALFVVGRISSLPMWASENLLGIAALLALLSLVLFYRFRRPRAPQTSYYQPVRIRQARVEFSEGAGRLVFMKIAFTSSDYLNVFSSANREAIEAGVLTVVKA